jgi:hypothetical protein
MDAMKNKLLNTVFHLREEGINFELTPPLFDWTYPEEPELHFQLLISKKGKSPKESNINLH